MATNTSQPQGVLHVTDSRTGRAYELPIVDGAIRALDLRQIKASDDDFGLLSYDPAFMNTASCRSAITYIDGEKGILRYRGLPDRGARRASPVPRRGQPADLRGAAGEGGIRRLGGRDHPAHLRARERKEVHRRVPSRRAPDGHPGEHDRGAVHVLPGREGDLRHRAAARADRPADREDADAGGVRLPARDGTAVCLPRRRTVLRGQLPEHDAADDRAPVQPGSGPDPRARRAFHPARRPRAELFHQRDAGGRQLTGRPVLGRGRGHGRAVRAAARRGERAGAADAQRHRLGGQHPRLHRPGQARRDTADGVRPPGLQELRPAGDHHQAGLPTRSSRSPAPTGCSTSRWNSSASRWPTITS